MNPSLSPSKSGRGNFALLAYAFCLCLLGLVLGPRIPLGERGANWGVEDALAVILACLLVYHFMLVKDSRIPTVLLLPLPYLAYTLFVTLIGIMRGILDGWAMAFWAKEIEYWVLFQAAYLTALHRARLLTGTILVAAVLLLAAGIVLTVRGRVSEYGVAAPFLEDSPSLSGLTFASVAVLAVTSTQLLAARRWWYLWPISTALTLLTVLTGSRVSLALLVGSGVGALMGFVVMPRGIHRPWIGFLARWMFAAVVLVGTVVWFYEHSRPAFHHLAASVDRPIVARALNRIYYIPEALESRAGSHSSRLEGIQGVAAIFGLGRGAPNYEDGALRSMTLSADSQFVRNLIEIGVLGTTIWGSWLLTLYVAVSHHRRARTFYLAVLAGYLAAGYGAEVFLLSKSGAAFWIAQGVILASRRQPMQPAAA